ncbi:MAG: DNA starvation/stationary phase protection protein Dps [Planctomycetes bacterium]|nr:DNA starvation/stationary phase protection protein Dps [Planctomycetota bacterium]
MSKPASKTVVPPSLARFSSSSRLSENSRHRLIATLNERLADGLDLQSQVKLAHWNVKGPHFAALHPLFDTFASAVTGHVDDIAERAVILGGLAQGGVRHAARASHLADYPADVVRDLEHAKLLGERFDTFAEGLRASRSIAEEEGDIDTADMLTAMLQETEKHAWFLRATLGN